MSEEPYRLRAMMFGELGRRFDQEELTYLQNTFNSTLKSEGIDCAYIAVIQLIVSRMDNQNQYINELVSVMAGRRPHNH